MSVDEIFQTMRDLVSEQFAMEPAEVTMEVSMVTSAGSIANCSDTRSRMV